MGILVALVGNQAGGTFFREMDRNGQPRVVHLRACLGSTSQLDLGSRRVKPSDEEGILKYVWHSLGPNLHLDYTPG